MAELKAVIEDFTATMDSLRDFVSNVGPVLLRRQEDAFETAAPTVAVSMMAHFFADPDFDLPFVPDETRRSLAATREMLTGAPDAPPEKVARTRELLQKLIPIKVEGGKIELDVDHPSAMNILTHTRTLKRTVREVRLLYESSIMALTSSSEWFVAQLIAFFFRKYPGAADSAEPFFNLSSLESLQTIEDAREVIIEHRVETLMRKSFDDWLQFFRDKPKLSLGYLNDEDAIPRIDEVFKRRNLIVHNGGRVSRVYLKEVEESLRKGLKLGEIIDLTPDYLSAAVNLIEHS
jgi:hypothetical protein